MVTNSFENNELHAANEKAPKLFQSCSHQVPELLPKMFPITPIAPPFYHIWFAQSWNSRVYKLKRLAIMGEHN